MDQALQTLKRRYPLFAALFLEHSRKTTLVAAGLLIILYSSVFVFSLASSKNLLTIYDAIIGGDFIVFWTAAQESAAGAGVQLYDPAYISEKLKEFFPAKEDYSLTWQYPPTMFFVLAPLAALPYLPAYFFWTIATTAALARVLFCFADDKAAIFLGVTAIAAFQAWITGQTGMATAALLAVAAGWAKRGPLIAGLAAAALTIKPQLGLLIPLAFAAAGCWRAFAFAAIGAVLLAGASAFAFGLESWTAFFGAVNEHGGRMGVANFPYEKLISPFGGLVMLGAPINVAFALHGGAALAIAAFVILVWRYVDAWDLRIMALTAAAPLVTPYAFYYELAIFIPPLLLLAKRGAQKGWLPGEKPLLILLWVSPLFLPGASAPGLPLGFLISGTAFFLCARRASIALVAAMTGPTKLAAAKNSN